MICFRLGSFRLKVHWSFWLLLGVVSAAPGQPVLLLGIAAAACHELGHLLVMLAVGMAPHSLRLSALGGRLQAKNFPCLWAELASVGAGAAVNLMLALVFSGAKSYDARLFSAINLVLGGFNLLPVQGLDGGRIVALAAGQRWPAKRARSFGVCLSAAALVAVVLWSFWLWKGHPHLPSVLLAPVAPTAAFFGWLRGGND